MSHALVLPENQTTDGANDGLRCPLTGTSQSVGTLTSDLCNVLEEAGCPLALSVQERLRFETLLAELSAAFVNLPADQIDSQIESALRRLVMFLGIDRGSLAELLPAKKQLVITHSYHIPGVPPNPRIILDEQLPWYARTIYQGQPLRLRTLPDDLPAEAKLEREYCLQVGMKSHVMIPLKMMDCVVGAIGFASFRESRDWADDLVIQRLRLVGEIFSNAVARKRADEALRAARERGRSEKTQESLREFAHQAASRTGRRKLPGVSPREMHDDWTQRPGRSWASTSRSWRRTSSAPERPSATPPARMQKQLVSALSEDLHAVSRQLHPAILDDLGLVEALRSECASFSHREGVAVTYRPQQAAVAVPKDVALGVYRVAQEALRNLAKHAAVKEARPCLWRSPVRKSLLARGGPGRGLRPGKYALSARAWPVQHGRAGPPHSGHALHHVRARARHDD